MSKRVLIVSDLHSGHYCGLTPPGYKFEMEGAISEHIAMVRKGIWKFWLEVLEMGPFDSLICNGDAIDGLGERSGGTELLTTNRAIQCKIAFEALDTVKAKKVVMTYGTPYHTGMGEDWEDKIAEGLNARIGSHEFVDIDGTILDLKHKIGTSAVPHGRHTAISREQLWSQLWADRGNHPEADYLIRSHAHYHVFNGDMDHTNIITPALQWDTKFGKRQCSGTVDIGVIIMNVDKEGASWVPIKCDMRFAKANVLKL